MNRETNLHLLTEAGITHQPGTVIDPEPNSMLHGHISPEMAVYVSSYPYGRHLLCITRYWIDTGSYGSRVCRQTNDPKRPGLFWNAPQKSTYRDGVTVLHTDELGHVANTSFTKYDAWTTEGYDEGKLDAFLQTYAGALSDHDKARLEAMRRAYHSYNARKEKERAEATAYKPAIPGLGEMGPHGKRL